MTEREVGHADSGNLRKNAYIRRTNPRQGRPGRRNNRTMDIRNNPWYIKALAFIAKNDLITFEKGTHMIEEGNLWVNIIEGQLKPREAAKLEAHNEFIDLQIPLSGPESFGTKRREDCTEPEGEFDSKGDCILYKDVPTDYFSAEPGEQIIFGPETAHAPMIGEGPIKKAVFKIRVV